MRQYDVDGPLANEHPAQSHTQLGQFQETVRIQHRGIYEVRLQSRSSIIFSDKTFTVVTAEPEHQYWHGEPYPARLYPGWWPEIVLPGGNIFDRDIPTSVEVYWRKIDPLAPDYDFEELCPTLEFYPAESIPDYCVGSNKFLHSPFYSAVLEPDRDGVLHATVPSHFAGIQKFWAAVSVNGDRDQIDSTLRSLVGDLVLVHFQPPSWTGDVQVELQRQREDLPIWDTSGSAYDNKKTLTGVDPEIFLSTLGSIWPIARLRPKMA